MSREAIIVGLGGKNHSGKDTGGDHLEAEHGFMHISISDVLRAEATRLGLDHQRPTLIQMGVNLRAEFGPGATVIRGIQLWEEKHKVFPGGIVLTSVRVLSEGEEVKRRGTVGFIDAPDERRYVQALQRPRGDETFSSIKEYLEQERAELEGLNGPGTPHLLAIRDMADFVIMNSGTKEEYYDALDNALALPAHQ